MPEASMESMHALPQELELDARLPQEGCRGGGRPSSHPVQTILLPCPNNIVFTFLLQMVYSSRGETEFPAVLIEVRSDRNESLFRSR
jgi:hypothetical protein